MANINTTRGHMWCRAGNFYPIEPTKDRRFLHNKSYDLHYEVKQPTSSRNIQVTFLNKSDLATVREICVSFGKRALKIELLLSPFKINEVQAMCNEIFLPGDISIDTDITRNTVVKFTLVKGPKLDSIFIVGNQQNFIKMIHLFELINKHNHQVEFPKAMFQEMLQLADFCQNNYENYYQNNDKSNYFKHLVESWQLPKSSCSELLKFMMKYLKRSEEKNFSVPEFITLLKKNHDPNHDWDSGLTPFLVAIHINRIDLIHLLLLYKANPFKRRCSGGDYTAFEEAKVLGQTDTLNAISAHFSRAQKPLMEVKAWSRETLDNVIRTTFYTNKGTRVTLDMCETTRLTPSHLEEIYTMYTRFFEKSRVCNTTLRQFFDEEVTGKRKFAESVFINGKFAGLQLYEIIVDPQYVDDIFFHISCIYLNEEARGLGLTNPLARTLMYVLQDLFADKTISGNMQCITYGSYSTVINFTHYPLYETVQVKNKVQCIVPHLQKNPQSPTDKPILHIGNSHSYTEIEVQVIKEQKMEKQNFNVAHFNLRRGIPYLVDEKNQIKSDESKLRTEDHRGVSVFHYATDGDLEMYILFCKKMNINPHVFIKNMSEHFRPFVQDLKPEDNRIKFVFMPKCEMLFFQNRRILSDSSIQPQAASSNDEKNIMQIDTNRNSNLHKVLRQRGG